MLIDLNKEEIHLLAQLLTQLNEGKEEDEISETENSLEQKFTALEEVVNG